jgi:hypothetical protein
VLLLLCFPSASLWLTQQTREFMEPPSVLPGDRWHYANRVQVMTVRAIKIFVCVSLGRQHCWMLDAAAKQHLHVPNRLLLGSLRARLTIIQVSSVLHHIYVRGEHIYIRTTCIYKRSDCIALLGIKQVVNYLTTDLYQHVVFLLKSLN